MRALPAGVILCLLFATGCVEQEQYRNDLEKIDAMYQKYKLDFPEAPEISVEEVVGRQMAERIVLVDNRKPDERAVSMIPGAISAKEFESNHTTVLEGFKGKIRYASPEQMGYFDGKIDGRSDYYSLGLTLFMAATGQPLEMGRTFAEAVDARRTFAGLPKGLPRHLRELMGAASQSKYLELKQMCAHRCPRELGDRIKRSEIMYHHEVTNQMLWSRF